MHELGVDRFHALGAFVLPAVDRLDHAFQSVVQLLDHSLGLILAGARQIVELRGRKQLALAHRADGVAAGRADHHHVPRARCFVKLAEERGFALLIFLLNVADAAPVFVAAELARHADQQPFDQLFHVAPELRALTRRQLQRPRTRWVVEVIDVAPVRRQPACGSLPRQQLLDQGALAHARGAGDVEVVAFTGHVHAELDGRDGAVLSGGRFEFLELFARLHAQRGRIGGAIELIRFQLGGWHFFIQREGRPALTQSAQSMQLSM